MSIYTNVAAQLVWLIFLAGVSACTTVVTPEAPSAASPLNPKGVIFSAQQSEKYGNFVPGQVEGTWTPQAADVAQLEAALGPYLQQADDPWLRPDPPIWERAPDYWRQYLGFVQDGRRVIYGNFFCSPPDEDTWQTELYFVLDGGDCYFQVVYDVESQEFVSLQVNGEA